MSVVIKSPIYYEVKPSSLVTYQPAYSRSQSNGPKLIVERMFNILGPIH